MSSVRLRRLSADHANLQEYVRRHPRVRLIQAQGDPPERYQLEYRIRSLRMVNGELKVVGNHLVEVTLPLNYPRTPPQCRMLSPVFHPNIAPHAICVGDHWSAGESLRSIITRIGEMLAYQSYNVKSPLNGEAARWVEVNKDRVPLDTVSLLVEEEPSERGKNGAGAAGTTAARRSTAEAAVASPPTATSVSDQSPVRPTASAPSAFPNTQPRQAAPPEHIVCPKCSQTYPFSASLMDKRVRCSKCRHEFDCKID